MWNFPEVHLVLYPGGIVLGELPLEKCEGSQHHRKGGQEGGEQAPVFAMVHRDIPLFPRALLPAGMKLPRRALLASESPISSQICDQMQL